MIKAFIAAFPGKCGSCGKRFRKGARVRYEEDVLVTVADCDDVEDEAPTLDDEEAEYNQANYPNLEEIGMKPEGVCRRCYTIHNGECL
jgi:hypothetical protein